MWNKSSQSELGLSTATELSTDLEFDDRPCATMRARSWLMSRLGRSELALLPGLFPDGVAPRSELCAIGLAPANISRRCRPGGPWSSPLRGVVLLTGKVPTSRQRLRAVLTLAGKDAVVSGVAALRALGMRRLPTDDRIHVLVPHDRRLTSQRFAVIERSSRLPEPVMREGLPYAGAARALVDASKLWRDLDTVRAMTAEAVQRGICTVDDLVEELAEPRRPHSALVRMVLAEIADGVRSAAEAWARNLVMRTTLPMPLWNVSVREPSGRLLAVPDAYWKAVGLAWEIDSREFHLSPAEHARDAGRQSRLAAAGVLVVHTVPSRLRTDPAGVTAELERAYRAAAQRPTPRLITTPN
jgi:hypothetical protein